MVAIISSTSSPSLFEYGFLIFLLYWLVYRPGRFKLGWLLNNCGAGRRSRRILTPGPDDYAIVTGASDGIGREYAKQLAARGYNLLLLSRTEGKLKRVREEIQEEFAQTKKIEIMAVDFSRTDIYDRVRERIEALDGPIHVLVNNVGMLYHVPEYFANYPDGHHLTLINTNIASMTAMTEIVVRIMQKQKRDPKTTISPYNGVIINLSSNISCTHIPMFSTYGASKAYVNYLSKILAWECQSDKILVQCVTPNQVETSMTKDLHNKAIAVDVKDFVRHALQTVGSEQQTNAHPKHKFLAGLTDFLEWLLGDCLAMKLKFSVVKQNRASYDQKVAPAPDKVTTEASTVNNNKP